MRQTSRSKAVRHARSGGQEPHTICHSWPTPLSICFERSSLSLAISPRCRRRRCGHLRNSRRRVIRAKQLMCPVRQIGSAGIFARDKSITPGALQTSPTVRATACKTLRQRGRLRQSRHRGICKLLKREDPRGFESHPLRHLPSLTLRRRPFGWSSCLARRCCARRDRYRIPPSPPPQVVQQANLSDPKLRVYLTHPFRLRFRCKTLKMPDVLGTRDPIPPRWRRADV
jgi:hypothetical protein